MSLLYAKLNALATGYFIPKYCQCIIFVTTFHLLKKAENLARFWFLAGEMINVPRPRVLGKNKIFGLAVTKSKRKWRCQGLKS